jgi:hypothetical protein
VREDVQNMPKMGIKKKSILKVALLRIFMFVGSTCSLSSPHRLGMMSELASLLSVRERPDSDEGAIRPGGRRRWEDA